MLKDISNKKYYLWWLLAVAIAFLPLFNLVRNHQPLTEEEIVERATSKPLVPIFSKESTPNKISTPDSSELTKPIFAPDESKEIQGWLERRGYLGPEDERAYGSYSDEILIALAKNNDLRAIMFLADKAIKAPNKDLAYKPEEIEKRIAKANAYWTLGAALGSTTALDYIALYMNRGLDAPEARPVVLNIMAIYKTIEMRGDMDLSKSSREHFVRERSVVLTQEEQQFVKDQANVIYQDLENRRRELGLGEFDNSMSESVKRFFGVTPP